MGRSWLASKIERRLGFGQLRGGRRWGGRDESDDCPTNNKFGQYYHCPACDITAVGGFRGREERCVCVLGGGISAPYPELDEFAFLFFLFPFFPSIHLFFSFCLFAHVLPLPVHYSNHAQLTPYLMFVTRVVGGGDATVWLNASIPPPGLVGIPTSRTCGWDDRRARLDSLGILF